MTTMWTSTAMGKLFQAILPKIIHWPGLQQGHGPVLNATRFLTTYSFQFTPEGLEGTSQTETPHVPGGLSLCLPETLLSRARLSPCFGATSMTPSLYFSLSLREPPCIQPFGELGKILYGKVQTWRLINTGHTMQSRRHRCLGDRPLLAGDSWGHDGKAVLHLRPRRRYKSTWNILQIASVVFAQLVSIPPFSRSPGFFWGIYCLSILGLCVHPLHEVSGLNIRSQVSGNCTYPWSTGLHVMTFIGTTTR